MLEITFRKKKKKINKQTNVMNGYNFLKGQYRVKNINVRAYFDLNIS